MFVTVSVVVFPVTFTLPFNVKGYAVGVEPVIAMASLRLTAETLFVDSFPVIFMLPVPAFAATFPVLPTFIAEEEAVF